MKPIELLEELDLICWETLLFGFQRGWVAKNDVENFAARVIGCNIDGDSDVIAELSCARYLTDKEILELLSDLVPMSNLAEGVVVDRWKLAMLGALDEGDLSQDAILDALQEVYVELGYPEDMSLCSIYSQDAVDPIVAMKNLIRYLRHKLT